MKKLLKIIWLFLLIFIMHDVNSQSLGPPCPEDAKGNPCIRVPSPNLILDLNNYLDSLEQTYNCDQGVNPLIPAKMVGPESFAKLTKSLFSRVVTDNDDAVKKGKAFNYTSNEDESTASFSHLFFTKRKNSFWNVNVAGKTEDNFLNLRNTTSPNYGLTIGANHARRIGIATHFFETEDCEDLQSKRKEYYSELLSSFYCLLAPEYKLKAENRVLELNREILNARLNSECCDKADIKKKITERDSLKDILGNIKNFVKLNNATKLRNYLDSLVSEFEVEKQGFTGYKLHWIDGGLNYTYDVVNIFDSSVIVNRTPKKQEIHKGSVYIAYNFLRNTKNSLLYFTGGIKFYNSYWLEDTKLTNYEFKDTVYNEVTMFKAYNNIVSNQSLDAWHLTKSPYMTFYCYPGQKNFGFELGASVKIQEQSAPIYDARFGFLYSLYDKEEDIAKGTVGLFVALNSYDSSTDLKGSLLAIGFKLGLPFEHIISQKK